MFVSVCARVCVNLLAIVLQSPVVAMETTVTPDSICT